MYCIFLVKSVLVKARFWGVTFFSSLFGLPARWELHFLKENVKAINCLYSVKRPLQHFLNRKSLVSLVITAGGAKCLIFFCFQWNRQHWSSVDHDMTEVNYMVIIKESERVNVFFWGKTIKFQLVVSILQLCTLLSSQNTIWF